MANSDNESESLSLYLIFFFILINWVQQCHWLSLTVVLVIPRLIMTIEQTLRQS